jgi:hypothetical protein
MMIMDSICNELGIRLERRSDLPALDEARDFMEKMASGKI